LNSAAVKVSVGEISSVSGVFQLLDDGPSSRDALVALAIDLPQERVVVRDIVRDRAGVTLQRRGDNIGEG